MYVRQFTLENVRSFNAPVTLRLDGATTILIGPNGGGKTNLLDALVFFVRKFLYLPKALQASGTADSPTKRSFVTNNNLNSYSIEPNHNRRGEPVAMAMEIEITQRDIESMRAIRESAGTLRDFAATRFDNTGLETVDAWREIAPGTLLTYESNGHQLHTPRDDAHRWFLEYLNLFEVISILRSEKGDSSLSLPLLVLPASRGASGIAMQAGIAGQDSFGLKNQIDLTHSRTSVQTASFGVMRLFEAFHRRAYKIGEDAANAELRNSKIGKEITASLAQIGYDWNLIVLDPRQATFDLRLSRKGSVFNYGEASSGERELLTYILSIYLLDIKDGFILIDEPELHLHPQWQKAVINLFRLLSVDTGNQFVLATHSPTFITPETIGFVSRVHRADSGSQITRLIEQKLPAAKHQLNIINSLNNERIFFADIVVLVEGISDRIVFEALLDHFGRNKQERVIEVVHVGGKSLFEAFQKILDAFAIKHFVIADQDYLQEKASPEIKKLFEVDAVGLANNALKDRRSFDGATLVRLIDAAIKTKDFSEAEDAWRYLESRHQRLASNLSEEASHRLNAFLKELAGGGVFILSRGALEDYLPAGLRRKDVDQVIAFAASGDFHEKLFAAGRDELDAIAKQILQ